MAMLNVFDFGPHAAFIWWSYFIVATVIGALIAWLVLDGRRIQRQLDALDAQGIRRRSTEPPVH
jgi:heme exporter protein D